MDNDFQTTFIPKKPVGESAQPKKPKRRNPSMGIFSMLAILLFVVAIIASAGIYFYERMLGNNIAAMQETLVAAEDRIEQEFIVELQNLDKRLRNANDLLQQHVAISPFFRVLEDTTLKSMQYDSFEFSFEEGRPVANITGRARRYRTIAEQSINFGESSLIETHVFSNFTLTQQGRVSFNLKIVPTNDVLYFERSMGRVADDQTSTSSFGSTVTTSSSSNNTDETNTDSVQDQFDTTGSDNDGDTSDGADNGDQQALLSGIMYHS